MSTVRCSSPFLFFCESMRAFMLETQDKPQFHDLFILNNGPKAKKKKSSPSFIQENRMDDKRTVAIGTKIALTKIYMLATDE